MKKKKSIKNGFNLILWEVNYIEFKHLRAICISISKTDRSSCYIKKVEDSSKKILKLKAWGVPSGTPQAIECVLLIYSIWDLFAKNFGSIYDIKLSLFALQHHWHGVSDNDITLEEVSVVLIIW